MTLKSSRSACPQLCLKARDEKIEAKKVQRRINKALAQADGGSAWGARAGAAATLARDARKGNGRVCYGARCAAGGGSPQGEVSLLAPAAATSEMHLRTGHAKGAQGTPRTQVGLRQVRGQGFIGASGSSFLPGGAGRRVCAEPHLLEQPLLASKDVEVSGPASNRHAQSVSRDHVHRDQLITAIP